MKRFALIAMLTLSGCVATGSTQLSRDTWSISGNGNAYTSSSQVGNAVLLKAAEIAIGQGKRYFEVLDGRDTSTSGTYVTPGQATTFSNVNVYGHGNYATAYGTSNTTYTPPMAYNFIKPGQTSTIRITDDNCGRCIDAEIIVRQFGKRKALPAAPEYTPEVSGGDGKNSR